MDNSVGSPSHHDRTIKL